MKIIKEFKLRNIAGEYVLVPVGATTREFSGMISVSSTAKCIWENIEKVPNLQGLIEKVTDQFEIDNETAAEDVTEFVRQLVEAGFVEYSDLEKEW